MKTTYLLLLLIPFFLVGCNKRSAEDYTYYKPYKKEVGKAIPAPNIQQNDTLKEVETPTPPIAEITRKGVDLNDFYFIVVASYVNKDNALIQKQKLTEQGFSPDIFMVNDDGWYKLAVQSYKTLDDAEYGLKMMIEKKLVSADARIVFNRYKPE